MPRRIDIESWGRREQYRFFLRYDQPFFNLCTEIEVGPLYRKAKAAKQSFYLACIHACLVAALDVPAFRQRLDADGVVEHDCVHAAATVLGADEVFRFCWLDYATDHAVFQARGRAAMDVAVTSTGALEPHAGRTDLVHFSVLPWIRFTGLVHPRAADPLDSVPKIVFGRSLGAGDGMTMPISIDVHHALADGIHVAKFLEALQRVCRSPG